MLHKNALPVSYVKQYKILESNQRRLKSMIPYTANFEIPHLPYVMRISNTIFAQSITIVVRILNDRVDQNDLTSTNWQMGSLSQCFMTRTR